MRGDYEMSESRTPRVTIKSLTIPSLSRDYQNKKVSCHASNTNLISPATKNIIFDINREYQSIYLKHNINFISFGYAS